MSNSDPPDLGVDRRKETQHAAIAIDMKFSMQPPQNEMPVRRPKVSGGGIKLLILVFMLILVLLAMQRAGDPRAWQWMFPNQPQREAKEGQPQQPGEPVDQASGDKQAAGPAGGPPNDESDANRGGENNEPNLIRQGDRVASLNLQLSDQTTEWDLRTHFWRQILESLNANEQLELWSLVNHAVKQEPLPIGQTATKSVLLSEITQQRQDYHLWLMQQLPSVNSSTLAETVLEVQQSWSDHIQPALRAVIDENTSPELIDAHVEEFPTIVQTAAWHLVRDHTPVSRPIETYAWFASWKQVFNEPILAVQPGESVAINQLLGQPQAFRGRQVTVRGRALQIHSVRAGKNSLGIDKYYVIWVEPDHASRYPFCIYSLIIPPELAWDETAMRSRQLESPIAVTGHFFKVRLFDSEGPAQAPLIMTTAVELLPEEVVAAQKRRATTFTPTVILLVALALTWISWTVFRVNRAYRIRQTPTQASDKTGMELSRLRDDERVQTVQQKLERLESGNAAKDV